MTTPEYTTKEVWAPVKGYEGRYEVSNHGRVRKTSNGKILSKDISKGTYILKGKPRNRAPYARVTFCVEKTLKKRLVSHLVLEAFVCPRPSPTHQANHKNGIHGDDCLENLEWTTSSENQIHSFRVLMTKSYGRSPEGHLNHRSKIPDIQFIFSLRALGLPQTAIAKHVGVHQTMVSYILRGKHWSQKAL